MACDHKNRSWLVGMNAEEGFTRVNDALAPLKQALGYSTAPGSTECIPAGAACRRWP